MADANSKHLSLTNLIYEIKTHSRFSELLEEWTIKTYWKLSYYKNLFNNN